MNRTADDLQNPEYLEEIVQTAEDTAGLPVGDSIDAPPEEGVEEWKVKCSNLPAPKFIACFLDPENGRIRRMRIKHITKKEINQARKRYQVLMKKLAAKQAAIEELDDGGRPELSPENPETASGVSGSED